MLKKRNNIQKFVVGHVLHYRVTDYRTNGRVVIFFGGGRGSQVTLQCIS